jgi:DNA-binding NtrC family response regulator
MSSVLIADDDRNICISFSKLLKGKGFDALTAKDGPEALAIVKEHFPDLVLLDVRMPGTSGLETFKLMKEFDPKIMVIIMTAYGTADIAIEAMKMGAYDYVTKPFDVEAMNKLIMEAMEVRELMKIRVSLPDEEPGPSEEKLVGSSKRMQQVYKMIGQVAGKDVTVLLRGESGTGKELVARAIYHHSNRSKNLFLPVNCAAIPEQLLESELFGYEKGAFTGADTRRIGKFEQCNGGTIFLDEIGDMEPGTQAKVLRVMERQEIQRLGGNNIIKVDVRIIAATNTDLEKAVRENKFREDLYYRLNVVTIHLPSLRERIEDIPELVNHFLRKHNNLNPGMAAISPEAVQLLMQHKWPGNVRELENVLKKALVLGKGAVLLPQHLTQSMKSILPVSEIVAADDMETEMRLLVGRFMEQALPQHAGRLHSHLIEMLEKSLIIEALQRTKGNQAKAAEMLGITRPTLRERLARYSINYDVQIVSDES